METPEVCEIVLTAPDEGWLTRFGDALVEDRLCAAVHRFEPIATTYRWRGEIYRKREWRASLHTRRSLVAAIAERVVRDHPYEVPGLAVLPIVDGIPAYLAWIAAETTPL